MQFSCLELLKALGGHIYIYTHQTVLWLWYISKGISQGNCLYVGYANLFIYSFLNACGDCC